MENATCNEKDPQEKEEKIEAAEERLEAGVFTPPLYKQRYSLVADILREKSVKSVADFGIAECKFVMYLRSIETIENIKGVDIDGELLERYRFLINPLTTDYIQPRDRPLFIQLWCGNVAECDDRMKDIDAVTLIEIIEHLEPATLEKLPENIFGYISPKLIVITTPNSEYNVLFPNFSGFRHWDHKFEWTRREFQDWCERVANHYQYTVTFTGVGKGGKGTEHLGQCTQIAVFTKHEDCERCETEENQIESARSYTLIAESQHPCKQDRALSEEQEILFEAQYYINMLINDHRQAQLAPDSVIDYEVDQDWLEIPLEKLLCFHKMKQKCDNLTKLSDVLEDNGSRLSGDRLSVIVRIDQSDSSGDSDLENQSDSADNDQRTDHNFETLDEDWDAELETNDKKAMDYQKFYSQNALQEQEVESWEDNIEDGPAHSATSLEVDRYTAVEYDQFMDAFDETEDLSIKNVVCDNCEMPNDPNTTSQTVSGEENQNKTDLSLNNPSPPNNTHGGFMNQLLKRYQPKFMYTGEKLYSNSTDIKMNNCSLPPCSSSEDSLSQSHSDQRSTRGSDLISASQASTSDTKPCIPQDYTAKNSHTCEPYLNLYTLMKCQGCGCEMRQLYHSQNYCGMSRKCTAAKWTESHSGDTRTGLTGSYGVVVDGQFSDIEEEL